MKNIWQTLPKPFLVQAPLDGVSDTVFRQVLLKAGKPDVLFTEFTNTDGLCSKGRDRVMDRLLFSNNEHPVIAQIWGNTPEHYFKSAQLIKDMGFDGIDINMGCPDRVIVSKGCCSGLIKNHSLAKELIQATKEGAGELPVSVKTRIGYKSIQTEEWIGFLLSQNLAALTVHGRTTAEMSKVPAHWDEIGKAVLLRNSLAQDTVIIGNGDAKSLQEAEEKHSEYGVDGVMIGRGIFHNLWVFDTSKHPVTLSEKLDMFLYHLDLFKKTWGERKDFNMLKKFYKVYINDIPDAVSIRNMLMACTSLEETISEVKKLQRRYS